MSIQNTLYYEKPYEEIIKDHMFSLATQTLKTEESQNLPIHWHPHVEILYVESGEILVNYNAERLYVKSNSVIIINSNAIHAVRRCNDEKVMYWVIGVDPGLLEKYRLDFKHTLFNTVVQDEKIVSLAKQMISEVVNKEENYIQAIQSLIVQALILLERNHSKPLTNDSGINKTTQATQKVIDYIHENFSSPFSLDAMCAEIGFTRFYISRLFKKEVGMSIVDYINEYRCHQAYHMIRTTDYKLSTIGNMCGFNSPSYFSKIYNQYLGRLPSSESRKNNDMEPVDSISDYYDNNVL